MTVSTKDEHKAGEPTVPIAYASIVPENESRQLLAASAPPAPFPPGESDNKKKKKTKAIDVMLCGDVKVRGRRIHTGTNTFISFCGNTTIDIRESELPQGAHLRFIIIKLCGDAKIHVPKGTDVSLTRVSLCGDKDIDVDESDEQGANAPPSISATIIAPLGSVRVTN